MTVILDLQNGPRLVSGKYNTRKTVDRPDTLARKALPRTPLPSSCAPNARRWPSPPHTPSNSAAPVFGRRWRTDFATVPCHGRSPPDSDDARRRHKTRSPSSSSMEPSVCRAAVVVPMDHFSDRPDDDRAYERVCRSRLLGDIIAGAAVISSLDRGRRPWARKRNREGGGGAGGGLRNAGAWNRGG